MAEALEKADNPQPADEFVKADPKLNPRNIAAAEIAARVAKQHEADFAEDNNVSSIDDDGNVTPAPSAAAQAEEPASEPAAEAPAETPAEPAAAAEPAQDGVDVIEPDATYEVMVDGQKLEVPGSKLIDAGIRTFQKETAADYRLKQASELLREAERRLASVPAAQPVEAAPQPKAAEPSAADLARAIQFGNEEQAVAAIAALQGRGQTTPEEINRLVEARSRAAVRDEMQFEKAVSFLQAEYGDLLSKDHLKRFFFAEENRYRTPKERGGLGDQRPYMEVYKDIGESIRREFNMPKPSASAQPSSQPSTPGSVQARVARKAAAPSVPRTAASRLEQADTVAKARTPGEIIAGIAAARGKNRLGQPMRKE